MKTRTFVLSGEAVDDFDLVMAISEAAAKLGCSFEGQESGDKIEQASLFGEALRSIEKTASTYLNA